MRLFIPEILFATLLVLGSCRTAKDHGTIRWWHFWSEPYQKETIANLIHEFEEQNPGIHIDPGELTWQSGHDKIATAFASNRGPDVVELGSDWVYEFASRGVLRDITAIADSVADQFQGWPPATLNDKRFAFPWLLGTRALFVNTELVPDTLASWDDLLAAVKNAHRPSEDQYGFGNTKREPHQLYKKILPFFWSNGGDVFDSAGKVVIHSPANIHALEFYLSLGQFGLLESQKILDDRFTEGKLGVVISGGWLIRKIEMQNPNLDYRVMLMPSPERNRPGISFYGGEYLAVSKTCAQPDAALKWMRFLLKRRNAQKLSALTKVTFPAAIDSSGKQPDDSDRSVMVMVKQMRYARSSPLNPRWTDIERILEDEVEQALYGKKTAEAALQLAHDRIVKMDDR